MPVEAVSASWIEGQVFLLRDHHEFPLVMTQPAGVNGADLLPLSLIGCAAWDVMSILQKQRQLITSFEVTAQSEREPQAPWRFISINITYRVAGSDLNEASIRRAIELAEEKYCSVYATLKAAIELRSELVIVSESR